VDIRLFAGPLQTPVCSYGNSSPRRPCLDHLIVDCAGFEVETFIGGRVAKPRLKMTEVRSLPCIRILGASSLYTVGDGWRILKVTVRGRFILDKALLAKSPGREYQLAPTHSSLYPVSIDYAAKAN